MSSKSLRNFKFNSSAKFKLELDETFLQKRNMLLIHYHQKSDFIYSSFQEFLNFVCLFFLQTITIFDPSPQDTPSRRNILLGFQVQLGKLVGSSNAYPALKLISDLINEHSALNSITNSLILDAANKNKHQFKTVPFDLKIITSGIDGYNQFIDLLSYITYSPITKNCSIDLSLTPSITKKKPKQKIQITTDLADLERRIQLRKPLLRDAIKRMHTYENVKDIIAAMKQINDFRGLIARYQEVSGKIYHDQVITLHSLNSMIQKLKKQKADIRIRESEEYNKRLSLKYQKLRQGNASNASVTPKPFSLFGFFKKAKK